MEEREDKERFKKGRNTLKKESSFITKKRDSSKKGKNGKEISSQFPIFPKLEVILGEIKAGNNGKDLKNMGISILLFLYLKKLINENQYTKIHNRLI